MVKPIRMSLLENAYDFLNESLRSAVRAEAEPHAWKFAVLNLVQAIELLLKARLQAAHPVLVYEDVDNPRATVSLSTAVGRITRAAGIELTSREIRSIRKAQKWRDAIVHYEFEMSPHEVKSVYVQLFEFLTRFHDEHTDFGALHTRIDPELWSKEAELMEFFRREIVIYHGVEVPREYPAEIIRAQEQLTLELHGKTYDRMRRGDGTWTTSAEYPCHDCAVLNGQLHVEGCDMEECPRCYGQLITCGCLWGAGPVEDELVSFEIARERHLERERDWAAFRRGSATT
jgi:hypothetical protein